MDKKTFRIEYDVYFKSLKKEHHITRIKNCYSEMHAKIRLNDYLGDKHKDFDRLVVIKCQDESMGGIDEIFNMFGNAFRSR